MLRAESRAWLGLLGRALWGGLSVSLLLAALVMLVGPAEAAGEQAGLRIYATDGAGLGNAPSLDTRIAIGISGVIARVRVEQRFYNPHKDWVEGVYVFPLPQNAAVDRLRMRYGGRLIEGEIQERQQARQNYERARDAGQGAGLLEQQRANVFTTAVANIPPGEAVAIEIE
ncbi:MAG: marine proteobacterial sortase target protein, partial [Gammaproteobacteria bacterium]|nr:marine proteobacterial sortase target protein [Gammaproteobacteria bacterium]